MARSWRMMAPGHPEQSLGGVISLALPEAWQQALHHWLDGGLAFSGLSPVLAYGVLVLALPLLLLPTAFPELSRPRDGLWSLVLAALAPLLLLNRPTVFSSAGVGELIATVLMARLAAEVGQGRWRALTPEQRSALRHPPRWRRAGADLVTAVVEAAKAAWSATARTATTTWNTVTGKAAPSPQGSIESIEPRQSARSAARKQWIRPEPADGNQENQHDETSPEIPNAAPETVAGDSPAVVVDAVDHDPDAEPAPPVGGGNVEPGNGGAQGNGADAEAGGYGEEHPAVSTTTETVIAEVNNTPEEPSPAQPVAAESVEDGPPSPPQPAGDSSADHGPDVEPAPPVGGGNVEPGNGGAQGNGADAEAGGYGEGHPAVSTATETVIAEVNNAPEEPCPAQPVAAESVEDGPPSPPQPAEDSSADHGPDAEPAPPVGGGNVEPGNGGAQGNGADTEAGGYGEGHPAVSTTTETVIAEVNNAPEEPCPAQPVAAESVEDGESSPPVVDPADGAPGADVGPAIVEKPAESLEAESCEAVPDMPNPPVLIQLTSGSGSPQPPRSMWGMDSLETGKVSLQDAGNSPPVGGAANEEPGEKATDSSGAGAEPPQPAGDSSAAPDPSGEGVVVNNFDEVDRALRESGPPDN